LKEAIKNPEENEEKSERKDSKESKKGKKKDKKDKKPKPKPKPKPKKKKPKPKAGSFGDMLIKNKEILKKDKKDALITDEMIKKASLDNSEDR